MNVMTLIRTFDAEVPALVLRLDRNPFHHGTLGAVRSLGRAGVEVHAVVEAADSPVVRSRFLRGAHLVPSGPLGARQFTELLLRVSDRIGTPAVLIAMDDASAIHVAAHGALLKDRYLLPNQPVGLPGLLADKAELAAVCARAGIGHPPSVVPRSADEAAEAVDALGLPLVAKWSRPWLLSPVSGLRSTTLVRSTAAVRALYARAECAGSRLLLQRYVPDAPRTDWFFHGYFSDTQAAAGDTGTTEGPRCLVGGSGLKELSWPARTGLTAKGRWQPNEEVEEAARRLVHQVGYRGILDLDFRRDEGTDSYQLLDVNPRPGAQFRLFTDVGGLDVVRAQYLDLTGQRVPHSVGRPGRVFMAENYALLSAAMSLGVRNRPGEVRRIRTTGPGAGFRQNPVTARGLTDERPRGDRRTTAPVEGPRQAGAAGAVGRRRTVVERAGAGGRDWEVAWFAGDDPMPFLAMLRAWFGRGAVKAGRRLRPPPLLPYRTRRPAPRPREPDHAPPLL